MSIKRLPRIKNLNDNHDNVTIMTMSDKVIPTSFA